MNLIHHPHAIYSKKPSKVYIVRRKNKRRCLDEAIQSSGFISHLNDKWQESGKPKDNFMIAIKPNFMCTAFEIDISVYTDVELVEHLIDRIRDQGYSKIKVVESEMVWSIFYNDRTVKRVAEMLGYSGEGYEIVDLTMEPELHEYKDRTLGKHSIGRTWKAFHRSGCNARTRSLMSARRMERANSWVTPVKWLAKQTHFKG